MLPEQRAVTLGPPPRAGSPSPAHGGQRGQEVGVGQAAGPSEQVAGACRHESIPGQGPDPEGQSGLPTGGGGCMASPALTTQTLPAAAQTPSALAPEALSSTGCGRNTDSGHWPSIPEETLTQGTDPGRCGPGYR